MGDVILCVGLVVVDIVTEVQSYPIEDTKSRCDVIREEVGGNATSNCRILSILGEKTSFMGCVGTTPQYLQLVKDFYNKYQVDTTPMVLFEGHPMPLSICILNKSTGSRTCVHYRGSIPELLYDTFINADLRLPSYKWVHFEGRYEYHDTAHQIKYLHDQKLSNGFSYKLSVELEKANEALVPLLQSEAEFMFISKDFAKFMGYNDMCEAVEGLSEQVKDGVTVVCPWGDQGAAAKLKGHEVVRSAAYPPKRVINTLGAGDTFIAACIKSLSNNNDLQTSLQQACYVAGVKCGLRDQDELASISFNF